VYTQYIEYKNRYIYINMYIDRLRVLHGVVRHRQLIAGARRRLLLRAARRHHAATVGGRNQKAEDIADVSCSLASAPAVAPPANARLHLAASAASNVRPGMLSFRSMLSAASVLFIVICTRWGVAFRQQPTTTTTTKSQQLTLCKHQHRHHRHQLYLINMRSIIKCQ
jgi:hypothetical protein